MFETIGAATLWAMHPAALSEFLAALPNEGSDRDALAARQNDPVRDGATLILNVWGMLSPSGTYWGTSTERFVGQVLDAANDDRIGAIILKVMSPGGLVFGTQEAGDAVFEARQRKPVIAVADKYAFSAAHWIATQASAFYVTPSGQVGSVGVRSGHVDISKLEEGMGVVTTLIASSPKKIAAHPFAPLSEEDRAAIQADVDDLAGAFNAAIARGRGLSLADVPKIHGTGETFLAKQAADLGVVDGVMTLREVVGKYASSRARLGLMRQRAELQGQSVEI